jgi:hypothetical protein
MQHWRALYLEPMFRRYCLEQSTKKGVLTALISAALLSAMIKISSIYSGQGLTVFEPQTLLLNAVFMLTSGMVMLYYVVYMNEVVHQAYHFYLKTKK